MRASAEWQRFGFDFPGYFPNPGLRPGDVDAIVAMGEHATRMRPLVEVACKGCAEWLILVWDVADDDRSLGAFIVIREKQVATAQRMLAEEGRDLPPGSSSTLSTKAGGVHLRLDDSTPQVLPMWCPKHGHMPTMSTAHLRTELVAARRDEKAAWVRLRPQQR